VDLLTNYYNLQGFITTKALTRRQARWAKWLAAFYFVITYRLGRTNPADGPSCRLDYKPTEGEGADPKKGFKSMLLKEL
jgi:hypothetical protein